MGIICRGVVLSTPPIHRGIYKNNMHLGWYVILPDGDYYGVGRQVAKFFYNDELAPAERNIV